MSDNATPEKKITRKRPKNFPEQATYMLPGDLKAAIEDDATRESAKLGRRVSKSEIARRYLQAGRAITDAAEGAAS